MEAAGVEPAQGIDNTQVADFKKGEKGEKGQKGKSTVQTLYKISLSSTSNRARLTRAIDSKRSLSDPLFLLPVVQDENPGPASKFLRSPIPRESHLEHPLPFSRVFLSARRMMSAETKKHRIRGYRWANRRFS